MILKRNSIVFVLITMLFVSACGFQNAALKRQGYIYADTYQREYYATVDVMTDPKATEAQKDIARQKGEILRQVWPLIKTYDSLVTRGEVPPDQLTKDISDLIDQLAKVGGDKWQSQKH